MKCVHLITSHTLAPSLRAEPGAITFAEGERPRLQRDSVLDARPVDLVNAALSLPCWGFRVGRKALGDLRAGLVVHLHTQFLWAQYSFNKIMIFWEQMQDAIIHRMKYIFSQIQIYSVFKEEKDYLDSQKREASPLVPEGKVDPFLVHLHRSGLSVDDHLQKKTCVIQSKQQELFSGVNIFQSYLS